MLFLQFSPMFGNPAVPPHQQQQQQRKWRSHACDIVGADRIENLNLLAQIRTL